MLTKDPIDVPEKLQNPPAWKPLDTCMKVKSKLKDRKPIILWSHSRKTIHLFLNTKSTLWFEWYPKRKAGCFPAFYYL